MSSIKLKGSSSGEAIITTASDGSSVILDKKLDLNGQHAKFVCVLALIDEKKNEFVFKGILKGKIVFPPRGKNGFGYDPIFVPLNFNKTLAQCSVSFKNSISHRKKALVKLLKHNLFNELTIKNTL